MRRHKPEGKCCICGAYGPLTYEHIPPEAAFNGEMVLEGDVEMVFAAQSYEEARSTKTKKNQRGAGAYTLCASCNSSTGSWYVPAYLVWARQGWLNLYQNHSGITHAPFEIEPLKVAKQIIAMFASACGPTLFANSGDLVRFVLNRNVAGLPTEIGLYAYYLDPLSTAARQSGITANASLNGSFLPTVYAEIAFPPFGYILCVNGSPAPDLRVVDIKFMADACWGERRTLNLKLPGLEVHSVLPADFRTEDQIRAAYRQA